jgi:hypothetical protein
VRRSRFSLIRKLLLWLLLAAAVAWALSGRLSQQWHEMVTDKLAERGVHLQFSSLFLHPLKGIVANDVRLFNDSGREKILVQVDQVLLDLDWSSVLSGRIGLEGVSVSQAALVLPLEPNLPRGEALTLQNFSAVVSLHDDELLIQEATGQLTGVQVSVAGTLRLSSATSEKLRGKGLPTPAVERVAAAERRLEFLKERRTALQAWLAWAKRFNMPTAPRLSLQINAELEDLPQADATLTLEADDIAFQSYQCKTLKLEAHYRAQEVELRHLSVEDAVGKVTAHASWRSGSGNIRFHVNSSADLPSLAKAFFDSDALHEVVFYDPPQLSIDGTWFVKGSNLAQSSPPVEATAKIQLARFNTRGEIFEGLSASVFVSPSGHYARDVILRHKTGTAAAQWMRQPEGFQYEAVMKMDPAALRPFVNPETKTLLQRFRFAPHSEVYTRLQGKGPTHRWADCVHDGVIRLRDFSYRDVDFKEANAEVQFIGRSQRFRNASLRRAEGSAEAAEVLVNGERATVTIQGGQVSCDPVALTACFAPPTAAIIEKYRFTPGTDVALSGSIGWKSPEATQLTVKFRTGPDGHASYPLLGRDMEIAAARGTLDFKNTQLSYDVEGSIYGGPMTATGTVRLGKEGGGAFTAKVTATEFPYPVFGKDLPFRSLSAVVSSEDDRHPFTIKSKLLGGSFTMDGAYRPTGYPSSTGYNGELKLDAVSFNQFAKIYSPRNETEGDLTGRVSFSGRTGDWSTLRGEGVGVILNGNLYAIPVLGPLTPLIGGLLPGTIGGYNVAKEANCTFTLGDGKFVTQDFEALTSAFRIVAKGDVDFIRGAKMQFTAQARMRGLPGFVFRPVSELLEYKGEGTVAQPQWRSAHFSRSKD